MPKIPSHFYLPFAEALGDVLQQFGITGLIRTDLQLKNSMSMEHDVCLILGLTDDIRGNLGISMPGRTALTLASIMMGGVEVERLDEVAKSALCEVSNMITARAGMKLSARNVKVDITPPTLVVGSDLLMIVSQVNTLSLSLSSSVGPFQINIGLETVVG